MILWCWAPQKWEEKKRLWREKKESRHIVNQASVLNPKVSKSQHQQPHCSKRKGMVLNTASALLRKKTTVAISHLYCPAPHSPSATGSTAHLQKPTSAATAPRTADCGKVLERKIMPGRCNSQFWPQKHCRDHNWPPGRWNDRWPQAVW